MKIKQNYYRQYGLDVLRNFVLDISCYNGYDKNMVLKEKE